MSEVIKNHDCMQVQYEKVPRVIGHAAVSEKEKNSSSGPTCLLIREQDFFQRHSERLG